MEKKVMKQGFHGLHSMNASYPFEWLAFDFFGPLKSSSRGNTIGFFVVDVYTTMVS